MKNTIRFWAAALAILLAAASPLSADASAGSTAESTAVKTEKTQDMNVTATVPPDEVAYTVTVPEAVSLGSLNSNTTRTITYQVQVDIENLEGGTLRISSPSGGTLRKFTSDGQDETFAYSNEFGVQYFKESGTASGMITVKKEALEKVSPGDFVGSLVFTIDYLMPDEEAGGVRQTAAVSVRKADDIYTESMCAPLFYPEAELELNGDGTATVIMYSVNPIPDFADAGTPITAFLVSGNQGDVKGGSDAGSWTENIGENSYMSRAEIQTKAADKFYEAAGAFVPSSGSYSSDRLTFTLPVSAIRNSRSGAVCVDAYVSAVMNSWQEFYLIFDVDDTFGKDESSSIQEGACELKADGWPGAQVNGLKDYVQSEKKGEYVLSIAWASSELEEDRRGISACASMISAVGQAGNASYYSINLTCRTRDGELAVADTGSHVLELVLPLKQNGDQKLTIYRYHEENRRGQTMALSSLNARASSSNRVDGTCYWDKENGQLYVYASRFSVYALHLQDGTSGPSAGSGSEGSTGETGAAETENAVYKAKVSLRKSTDIDSVSMCDGLFHNYADLEVNGSSTKLTLYVIDPIPEYSDDGAPLSNVKFRTSSGTVSASVDSTNKVSRYYEAYSGFIPKSGNYYSDVITVTLPTSALKNTAKGTVLCSAYIRSVMNADQSFYVVLGDWEKGETESDGEAEAVTVTAEGEAGAGTVADAGASGQTLGNTAYTARISMRKSTSLSTVSMCNSLFYSYADLQVNGDSTQVTLYVIDPIPNYSSAGTPLKNVKVKTSAGTVSASMGSSKVNKNYDADGAFISAAGSYPSTPVTVTLPTAAIQNSSQGTILCSAYVNVVMKAEQSFYVVFSDIRQGEASSSAAGLASGSPAADPVGTKTPEKNESVSKEAEPAGAAVQDEGRGWLLCAESAGLRVMLWLILPTLAALAVYGGYLEYRRRRK